LLRVSLALEIFISYRLLQWNLLWNCNIWFTWQDIIVFTSILLLLLTCITCNLCPWLLNPISLLLSLLLGSSILLLDLISLLLSSYCASSLLFWIYFLGILCTSILGASICLCLLLICRLSSLSNSFLLLCLSIILLSGISIVCVLLDLRVDFSLFNFLLCCCLLLW